MCNIDPRGMYVTFVLIFQGEPDAHLSCGNPYLFLSHRRVPPTAPRSIDSQTNSQDRSTSSSTETTSSESSLERSQIDEKPAPASETGKPERKRRVAKPIPETSERKRRVAKHTPEKFERKQRVAKHMPEKFERKRRVAKPRRIKVGSSALLIQSRGHLAMCLRKRVVSRLFFLATPTVYKRSVQARSFFSRTTTHSTIYCHVGKKVAKTRRSRSN